MDAARRGDHATAAEQHLQSLGGRDAGAEIARRRRRWSRCGRRGPRETDRPGSPSAASTATGRRGSGPPFRRGSRHAEVLLEAHPARHEDEQRRAHAERRRGDRRDSPFLRTQREHVLAKVEHEEVEAVDVQVDAVQESLALSALTPRGTGAASSSGLMARAISAMTSTFGRPTDCRFAPTCRLKLCSSNRSKSARLKRRCPAA